MSQFPGYKREVCAHIYTRRRQGTTFVREHRIRWREREYRGKCSPSSPFDLSQAPGTESLSFVIITRPSTGKGSLFGGAGLFLAYLRLHLIARFVHCSFRLFLPPPVLSSFFEHLPRNFVRKGEGPYFFTSLANVKCLVYIDPFLSREKVNCIFLFSFYSHREMEKFESWKGNGGNFKRMKFKRSC